MVGWGGGGGGREEDFIGIIFLSAIFSYLFLFLKPSLQPLTPNLGITVSKISRTQSMWRSALAWTFLCWPILLVHFISKAFTLSLPCTWKMAHDSLVLLSPWFPHLHWVSTMLSAWVMSKPVQNLWRPIACWISRKHSVQDLGPWEILTCVSRLVTSIYRYAPTALVKRGFSVTLTVFSYWLCYFQLYGPGQLTRISVSFFVKWRL